jgi:hypothetical protein
MSLTSTNDNVYQQNASFRCGGNESSLKAQQASYGDESIANCQYDLPNVNASLPMIPESAPLSDNSTLAAPSTITDDGDVLLAYLQRVPDSNESRHRVNVRNERYSNARPIPRIYTNPSVGNGSTKIASKYQGSLYKTPYNEYESKIAVGQMYNPYTQTWEETYENQLPPPNTNKGVMTKKQLQKINPKLLWANGGYNHHNPPPRRVEQSSQDMRPVEVHGGRSPFGPQLMQQEVVARLKEYVARDIFNNRNGETPVEISLHGEQPAGYVGKVPRFRPRPFLPATQELDLNGRTMGANTLEADTTKREEWTGETFARKNHLTLENYLPIAGAPSDGQQGIAASMDPLRLVQRADNPSMLQHPADAQSNGMFIKDHVSQLQGRHFLEQQNPLQGFDGQSGAGSILTSNHTLRVTSPEQLQSHPQFSSTSLAQDMGPVYSNQTMERSTLKGTLEPLPTTGQTFLAGGGQASLIYSNHTLQDTLKGTLEPLPTTGQSGGGAAPLVYSNHTIERSTQKGTLEPLPITNQGAVMYNPSTLYSNHSLQDTQKGTLEPLPTTGQTFIAGGGQSSTLYSNHSLQDTQKGTLEPLPTTGQTFIAGGGQSSTLYSNHSLQNTQKGTLEPLPTTGFTYMSGQAPALYSNHTINGSSIQTLGTLPQGNAGATQMGGVLTSNATLNTDFRQDSRATVPMNTSNAGGGGSGAGQGTILVSNQVNRDTKQQPSNQMHRLGGATSSVPTVGIAISQSEGQSMLRSGLMESTLPTIGQGAGQGTHFGPIVSNTILRDTGSANKDNLAATNNRPINASGVANMGTVQWNPSAGITVTRREQTPFTLQPGPGNSGQYGTSVVTSAMSTHDLNQRGQAPELYQIGTQGQDSGAIVVLNVQEPIRSEAMQSRLMNGQPQVQQNRVIATQLTQQRLTRSSSESIRSSNIKPDFTTM